MTTTFTPTPARDLRRGDRLKIYNVKIYNERVATNPRPCEVHRGCIYFEVEGFDELGRYNGLQSDVCCDPEMVFVVRTTN